MQTLNQQREVLEWKEGRTAIGYALYLFCTQRRALLSACASVSLCCSVYVSVLLGAAASTDCQSCAEIDSRKCTMSGSEYVGIITPRSAAATSEQHTYLQQATSTRLPAAPLLTTGYHQPTGLREFVYVA